MPPPFGMPPTFILQTKFVTPEQQDELHRLEQEIDAVFNINEAELVLGKVTTRARAKNDLRMWGLNLEKEAEEESQKMELPEKKRRKMSHGKEVEVVEVDSGSETMDENDGGEVLTYLSKRKMKVPSEDALMNSAESDSSKTQDAALKTSKETSKHRTIKVLNIEWYHESVKVGKQLSMDPYLVYEGLVLPGNKSSPTKGKTKDPGTVPHTQAQAHTPPATKATFPGPYGHRRSSPTSQRKRRGQNSQLVHQDTSEHDTSDKLPPLPDYLTTNYSCQRPTPMHSPNDDFIAELKIIRHARELEDDTIIGHHFSPKSYSASIAAIQAYPYKISSIQEIMRLPGCGDKIGTKWLEWHQTGKIREVEDIKASERFQALHSFWSAHQIGSATAREFYDKNGWKDLDDVIEFGWKSLSTDQQIGIKYYEDFQLRIPRSEVEATEKIVLAHANALREGFQICTVGGYRRGKSDCGDMDFILSHPSEKVTQNFLGHLLDRLVESGWVKHELTVSFRNSNRGQETLAWRGADKRRRDGGKSGYGFDTLDHAFVVWKNPRGAGDGEETYPHRRVDIIISPWKTAGCAVLGWTGGTIFERHLRSYTKQAKGWKFDSSGVRVQGTGEWVDLESSEEDKERDGPVTLEEKEKRVFEGLGLVYRVPTLRCTH